MATNVSFTRGTDATGIAATTAGLITFNTANATIYLGTSDDAVPFQCMNRVTYIFGNSLRGTVTSAEGGSQLGGATAINNTTTKTVSVPGIVVYFTCTRNMSDYTTAWGSIQSLTYSIDGSTTTSGITSKITMAVSGSGSLSGSAVNSPTFNYVIGYIPFS